MTPPADHAMSIDVHGERAEASLVRVDGMIEIAQDCHETLGHELNVHVAVIFEDRFPGCGRKVPVLDQPVSGAAIREIEMKPPRPQRIDLVERVELERCQRSQTKRADQTTAVRDQGQGRRSLLHFGELS
jgi:hypothetical protein